MTAFVLDNFVTMRWCFDVGAHPYADAILLRLGTGSDRAFVPVIWCYEVSAVLARAQRTGVLPDQKAEAFLASLQLLPIIVDARSGDSVLSEVHPLATKYGLTSYDAAYLELAQRLGFPIATLDIDLLKACQAAGVSLL